jgi:flavin-dependent dehydrogenase
MTVNATLDRAATASRLWDVVVVGAGPAGALAARLLAAKGLAVLLVDRAHFPRGKVCGGCLNGRALALLARAGLGMLPRDLGAVPIDTFLLGVNGRRARLALPAGVAVSRHAFDAALVGAAIAAGAHFLPGTRAHLVEFAPVGRTSWSACSATGALVRQRWDGGPGGPPSDSVDAGERRLLLEGDGEAEVRARLVLAADGLGGRLLRDAEPPRPAADSRLGAGVLLERAPDAFIPGIIYMACDAGGYVGLVRVEEGRLDVAAALDPEVAVTMGGPGALATRILHASGLPDVPHLDVAPWRGTPLLTRRAPRLAAERLFALGDAAGYVEPFTGEGIAWALASAEAVVPLALRAVARWEPALADSWADAYRNAVGGRQGLCRWLARLLRHPTLLQGVVQLLGCAPFVAGPVVRRLNREVVA